MLFASIALLVDCCPKCDPPPQFYSPPESPIKWTASVDPKEAGSFGTIDIDFFFDNGRHHSRLPLERAGTLISADQITSGYVSGILVFTKAGSGGIGHIRFIEYEEQQHWPVTIPSPTIEQRTTENGIALWREWIWIENNRLFWRAPVHTKDDCMAGPTGGELVFEWVWGDEEPEKGKWIRSNQVIPAFLK